MATKAFVLIETAVGKAKNVIGALQGVEGVKSVDAVAGPYDVIVVIEGADLNAIGNLVTKNIHSVAGVTRTITCFAVSLT